MTRTIQYPFALAAARKTLKDIATERITKNNRLGVVAGSVKSRRIALARK